MAGGLALRGVLEALYFSGAQALASRWLAGRGAILMLHHVQTRAAQTFAPNAHLAVDPAFLDSLLQRLISKGTQIVSLDEAVSRLQTPQQPGEAPFVAITLDDGYKDNLVNAVPVFRKHAAPFTIFVAPGLIDGQASLWWEDLEAVIASRQHIVMHSPKRGINFDLSTMALKRKAFGELVAFFTNEVSEEEQRRMVAELAWQAGFDSKAHLAAQMMRWDGIVSLAADPLCTIGAHTIHHYAVARLTPEAARYEMAQSASIIEMETGRKPRHFAYPYGYRAAAGPRDFAIAQECGFASAVTTRHGVLYVEHSAHLHALPRISVNGNFQELRHMDTLLSGLTTWMANRGAKTNLA